MVVITYDPFLTGTLGLALKWLTGARFVCEVNGPYGQAVTFAEGTPGALARVKPAIMRSVGGAVLRHADAVKLLYRGQLDGLPVEEGALAPEVFFNAVDSSVFSPIAEVEQEDLILFVGFPFKLKGVDLLLEAFAEVAPDFPGWRLAMIGFRLEEAAIEEGHDVPPGATFFPPEPPERIREWMARCKIFVLPSRAEAMGRVLVEAALMGRARLAARVGGIPTIVEDEVDGLLFDPGDAGDLARQLRRLMEDRPLRRRIEAATLERAESFREEVYVERYRRLIEELAGGSPRPDGSPPRSKR